jgi:hypothetical protein
MCFVFYLHVALLYIPMSLILRRPIQYFPTSHKHVVTYTNDVEKHFSIYYDDDGPCMCVIHWNAANTELQVHEVTIARLQI